MTFFLRAFLALFLLTTSGAISPAVATAPVESSQVALRLPTVEGLIAHWEETVAAAPYNTVFAKTEEEGVYDFETTFFPYKGRLKLLNAAVIADADSYYDDVFEGIVEITLPDADAEFYKKLRS